MTAARSNPVRLIDDAEGPPRTTATLVASLTARLGVLHLISGADAVGSLTAGFAALGREVSRTAAGLQLRRAIESGRPGMNGNALWKILRIEQWASAMPPSSVLEQLRNDVALLLADDLEDTLQLLPIPGQSVGVQNAPELETATFVDCLLGLWAFSGELVRCVEALATPTFARSPNLVFPKNDEQDPESSLLR